MRKMLIAFLTLAGASSLLMPVREYAYADIEQAMMPEARDVTRAAKLRTAKDPEASFDPDTVWIGHIYDQTWDGPRSPFRTSGAPDFTPTMAAGGYGPYRVGRGINRPNNASGALAGQGFNGVWDFDRFQGEFSPNGWEQDSLQGWWPLPRAYQSGATTFPDHRYAFMGLDYGNGVNYVINQGAPKRTFGVVGLWHRDGGSLATGSPDSISGTNVQPVTWSPANAGLGGVGSTASAWMGMRSHGDLSHVDLATNGGTGNPFNSSLLQYQGNNGQNAIGSMHVNGTDHNFPGYGSQMDQMLYRDIVLTELEGLSISFNFSTNMSLGKNTTPGARVGWFDKDPISNAQVGLPGPAATPSNDGNFIGSFAAGLAAPCDSFMVYIGVPVDEDSVCFSFDLSVGGNAITTVYDKKRRWFSEVLKLAGQCEDVSPCTIRGKQLASYAGDNPPGNVTVDVGAIYPTILQDLKDADGAGGGGTVRLVFRVKTNRGFDDENGGNAGMPFSSGTAGAAIVDNVVVNSLGAAWGDFEALDAINNDTAVDATNAWKSTGKPPAAYFHAHDVSPGQGLVFNDPCGSLDNPNRQCNLYGKVVTSGDHDAAEKDGGLFGSNTQDRQRWFVSPTINLSSTGNSGSIGVGGYNSMGIDDEVARTTADYNCMFSYYNAGHVNATTQTGNFISVGWQSYPARQINGNIKWGEARHTPSIFFYGTRGCFETTALGGGAKFGGLIRTTNPENRPDSLRLYLHRISRCYTFASLVAATCSPTSGDNVGTYFDNISIALIDGGAPPAISIPIWMLINDAFPANRNDAMVSGGAASFDTTAAQIRIGLNTAANTGTPTRPNISGDSVVITATGANARVDMVFRILPGPGNYVTIGNKASGIRGRPDVAVATTASEFFGAYRADPGTYSSTNTHSPSVGHGSIWSQHVWNSAQMDTVENNLFPTVVNGSVVGLLPGNWRGTYHESDGKFNTLGITKNICYMPLPNGVTNSNNIQCDGVIGAGGWDPANYPTPASGWDGVTVTTKEHTKIIPDGLLTPGSHVQYFFRKSDVGDAVNFSLGPDTNFVFQDAEASTDGHRWQQFGVLPDRWKDGAWAAADQNAPAPACMLYIDWEDRRGDERFWVMAAGEIGATAAARGGAHNGWRATSADDITVSIATDPSIAVYTHGGQPGTIWDMYGVKASESSTTSSSLGPGTAAANLQLNKDDRRGPTGLMLTTYYQTLLILTGDLNAGNIGPYNDKGSDDEGLLNNFATSVDGTTKPRGIWVMGRAFMEGQILGGGAAHPNLVRLGFGADLLSGDYRSYAANTNDIVDLTPVSPIVTDGSIYGVLSNCVIQNDVLTTSGLVPSQIAATYPDGTTLPATKIASIYAPSSLPASTHEAVTLVEGFRIQSLGTYGTLSDVGRSLYFSHVMGNLYGALNCNLGAGGSVGVGELPNDALVNFLALRSENPHRGGNALIKFGITRKEKVELKVYDVTGRLVKTLANREFKAGEHDIFWDGSNDDGHLVSRGVYFYQLRTPSFVSQKKLAVLRH